MKKREKKDKERQGEKEEREKERGWRRASLLRHGK